MAKAAGFYHAFIEAPPVRTEERTMATIRKRRTKDGDLRYQVQVRMRGYRPESASFERLTDARKWEQQTEAAMREGRHFQSSQAKKHTLSEAIERYQRDVLPDTRKTAEDVEQHLRWWNVEIGQRVLADVTPALITQRRDKLRSGNTPQGKRRSGSTVNRYLQSLSHVFSVAEREWEWIASNPLRKVRRLKEPRGRVRYLDDAERERLLRSCRASSSDLLYPIVVLALSVGARKSELLSLTWKDIDLKGGYLTIQDSKNDERRTVPLRGHALELMQELSKVRRIDTPLCFPGRAKPSQDTKPLAIRTAWESALKTAGIDDFRFHDLRHSCASYLAMQSCSPSEIAEVLGHKTLQMVKRYAHLSPQHTASVVEKMNEELFGSRDEADGAEGAK